MTLEEVAEYLRVSSRTVYDWSQKGQIPCGKLGTAWRYKRSEIEKWVNKNLSGQNGQIAVQSVRIEDVLAPSRVLLLDVTTKREALDALIDCLAQVPDIGERDVLAEGIYRREKLLSTGIGLGIAIPHVRLDALNGIVMAAAVSRSDIVDYESLDGQPVRMIFMLAAGRERHVQYIKTIAALSTVLKDKRIAGALLAGQNPTEIYDVLIRETKARPYERN